MNNKTPNQILVELRQEQRAVEACITERLAALPRYSATCGWLPGWYLEGGAGRALHLRQRGERDSRAALNHYALLLNAKESGLHARLITSDPADPYLLVVIGDPTQEETPAHDA